MSTTVRISESDRDTLRAIAKEDGVSLQSALEQAIQRYEEARFFESVNAAYAHLKEDPVVWSDYQQELGAWDVTLRDGLEAEIPAEGCSPDSGAAEQIRG